jgi:SSS family solute:Na+ symporter
MELQWIDWSIIILFLLTSLGIGIYYKKKSSGSLSDFFLGGRNLPWYIAGTSMVATTFAADTPLAVAELVANNGIAGNWLWWSFLLGGTLTTFFFAPLWRKANVLTEVELLELRYDGKKAALLRGFKAIYLGVFINILIIGWVNLALNALLVVFFDIPPNEVLYYTGAAMLLAALYSSLGGLWGVAVTDAFQFVIAMIGSIVLAVIVVNSEQVGGIAGLKEKLPPGSLNFFPQIGDGSLGAGLTLSFGAFLAYAGFQWWASWYPGAEPGGGGYVAQRMMSTKSPKDSVYATLLFQIGHYCIRPWPWIIVALCAVVLYPDLAVADKKLGYVMAMKEFLPTGMKGLLLAAFLAAYMSTISTQLNWGAGYVVNDFVHRFVKPDYSQKQLVKLSRIITLVIMALALVATSFMDSISGVWTFLIECGAGLGLVLILRWYWSRINAWSEITATLAPFIFYAMAKFVWQLDFPNSFFFTIAFTTVSWVVVTLITKPEPQAQLLKFYNQVQPNGWWKSVSGENLKVDNMLFKVIGWISAIILIYGSLFGIGYFILGDNFYGILSISAATIGAFGVKLSLYKTVEQE